MTDAFVTTLPDELLLQVFRHVVENAANDPWSWLWLKRSTLVCRRWWHVIVAEKPLQQLYTARFHDWVHRVVIGPGRRLPPNVAMPHAATGDCDVQTFALELSHRNPRYLWALAFPVRILSFSWNVTRDQVPTGTRLSVSFLNDQISGPSTTLINSFDVCGAFESGGFIEWPQDVALMVRLTLPAGCRESPTYVAVYVQISCSLDDEQQQATVPAAPSHHPLKRVDVAAVNTLHMSVDDSD